MNRSSLFKILAGLAATIAAIAVPFCGVEGYPLFIISIALTGAIIAMGLNITNGYLGVLNLSAGGQVAIGAYVCALGTLNGLSVPAALLLSMLGGAVVATLIFVLFARLAGFFFGLATIAAAEVIRLLLRNFDGLTHGVRGLRGFPKLAETQETTYWLLLACLVATLAVVAAIMRSNTGLRWRAIHENKSKALSLGVPVWRLQLAGFSLAGTLMSFGGALLALQLQYIEPGIAGLNTLVQAILMIALGGAGTLFGPLVGALVITLIPEFLRMANELRLIIYGVALILVVLTIPGGIVGALNRQFRTRKIAARVSSS